MVKRKWLPCSLWFLINFFSEIFLSFAANFIKQRICPVLNRNKETASTTDSANYDLDLADQLQRKFWRRPGPAVVMMSKIASASLFYGSHLTWAAWKTVKLVKANIAVLRILPKFISIIGNAKRVERRWLMGAEKMLRGFIRRVWNAIVKSLDILTSGGRRVLLTHCRSAVTCPWSQGLLILLAIWFMVSAQGASPTLPPAPPRYPDLRKGAWFVQIWDIDGDGEIDTEIKDEETGEKIKALDYIISTLKKANVDWVAVKLGDGRYFYPGRPNLQNWLENQGYLEKKQDNETPEERERKACEAFEKVIAKFDENGIHVLGWQFVWRVHDGGPEKTGGTPEEEAEVAIKILNLSGISGFIVNAEDPYYDKRDEAIVYMERIRAEHPDSFIAYCSFAWVKAHEDFPYKEFGYYCNAFMPQCYWGERPTDPETEMETCLAELNAQNLAWWQDSENEKEGVDIKPRDAVKPVIPVGMSYDRPARKTTPEEIEKFCQIAWGYGYPISIYRAEQYYKHDNEKLEAMGPKDSEKWKRYGESPDAVAKALQFLRAEQREDGSWLGNVGITALSVLCFLNAGCGPGDPTVIRGIQYILDNARDDGSITNSNNKVYETSLALLALIARQGEAKVWSKKAEKYQVIYYGKIYDKIEGIIARARDFLENVQRDETEGFVEKGQDNSWQYGGFGYEESGARSRPDLSNTQFAVMALSAAYSHLNLPMPELGDKSKWCYKATVFVSRCQNKSDTNDLPWAKDQSQPSYNDGGFIYLPGQSNAGGTKSYGSMTAAGIWCLRLCGVPETDRRVKAALQWFKVNENLEFDDNPGMGTVHFLYYYYMTFAKAMAMCPDEVLPGWKEALRQALEKRQDPKEGYWKNSPEYKDGEDNPELATAFAILALQTKTTVPKELWMTLILHSSADLHVYDPKGRHLGKNYETGELENEIPDASFDIDPEGNQVVTLRTLESGTYRIELLGTDVGEYSLTINGYADGSLITSKTFRKTIQKGQTHVGKFTVVTVVGPLTVYAEAPLPVPSGLVARAGDKFVDLVWEAYTEPGYELVGYNVYRSESKGSGYQKINSEPIQKTWFRDTNVTNNVTYYYAVTAVDKFGNETERSRYAKATPSAAYPPLLTISAAPNPVGSDGVIFFYNLPNSVREAKIVIFNITGSPLIEIPLDTNSRRYPAAGRWKPVDANGIPLANGPYIYVLIADGKVIGQGKMVIQR